MEVKEKIELARGLIKDLIYFNEEADQKNKENPMLKDSDCFNVFHLKNLSNLLDEIAKELN